MEREKAREKARVLTPYNRPTHITECHIAGLLTPCYTPACTVQTKQWAERTPLEPAHDQLTEPCAETGMHEGEQWSARV